MFSNVAEVLNCVPDAVVDLAGLLGAEVGAVGVVLARVESKIQEQLELESWKVIEEAYPGLALLIIDVILGDIFMIAPLNPSNYIYSPYGDL